MGARTAPAFLAGLSEIHIAIICGLAGVCLYIVSRHITGKRNKFPVKFLKLHDVTNNTALLERTRNLVLKQWPGREEANYVPLESFQQSSDSLPCHIIAIRNIADQRYAEGEVMGHVVLRQSPNAGSQGKERFAKMLKVGVPVETVKKAARVMGVEISDLVQKYERGESFAASELESENSEKITSVIMASLVVGEEYRGQGIGKALCAFAVTTAKELEASRVTGTCSHDLVPFYYHLGCHKATAAGRTDMPRVKLGNEIFVNVDNKTVSRAEEILRLNCQA